MDQASGPPLGSYGNNLAVPGQRAARRNALRLRGALWKWSSIADVRKCGRVPSTHLMPMREGPEGIRLGGLCRCHSIWACPVCAPEIRASRGQEIALAVELHLLGGGGVEFGSATLRHGAGDRLKDSFSVVAKSWNAVCADWAVKRFREAHGYWGFVRTVEVTVGFRSGWHPHVHWLDFWEHPLTPEERAEYAALVYGAWSRSVVRQGMGEPSRRRGVVLLPVRDGAIADYVTELSPSSAGHELTQLSTKTAKASGLTPFDILEAVANEPVQPWLGLWWEYESATRGRRMLGASRYLLKRLGICEEDPVPSDGGLVVGHVDSDDWGRLRFAGRLWYGTQLALEEAARQGQVGINECMRLMLGGDPVAAVGSVQLELGPGDDGGMF